MSNKLIYKLFKQEFVVNLQFVYDKDVKKFYGSQRCVEQLKQALTSGRIANTWLFVGPTGVGKSTLAKLFSQSLVCTNQADSMQPCGLCSSCKAITALDCQDFVYLLPDRKDITTDYINRSEIASKAYVYPTQLNKKIIFFDHAHYLNPTSANQLLKLFEETPASTLFILATDKPQKMLPTILSRSQKIQLYPMSDEELISISAEDPEFNLLHPELKKNLPILAQGRYAIASKLYANPITGTKLLKTIDGLRKMVGQGFSASTWMITSEFADIIKQWSDVSIAEEENIQRILKPNPADYPEFYKGRKDDIKQYPISTERKKELARIASHQIIDWIILGLYRSQFSSDQIQICLQAKEFVNRNINILSVLRYLTTALAS